MTLHLGNSFGQLAEQHNWYSQLKLLFALIFNQLDTLSDKGSLPTTNSSADQFTKEREDDDDDEDWLDSVLG